MNKDIKLTFKNKEDVRKYLQDNSKHYTPNEIGELIGFDITQDLTDKLIVETSCGEGDLLINSLKNNKTANKARYKLYDLENFNLEITKQRLINELNVLPENIETFEGNTLESNSILDEPIDILIQNPPYGKLAQSKCSPEILEVIGMPLNKKGTITTVETAFFKLSTLANESYSVLPLGVAFRGGQDKKARKELIDTIKEVVYLPDQLFLESTSIPVVLLKTKKEESKTIELTNYTENFEKVKSGKKLLLDEKPEKRTIQKELLKEKAYDLSLGIWFQKEEFLDSLEEMLERELNNLKEIQKTIEVLLNEDY